LWRLNCLSHFCYSFLVSIYEAYSNLVQYEYENLPEQWVKDGEPNGMVYWKAPKRSKSLLNLFVRSNSAITLLRLLFHTPKWIENHSEAQEYLKDVRKNALWWNIGVMGFALLYIGILFISTLWVK